MCWRTYIELHIWWLQSLIANNQEFHISFFDFLISSLVFMNSLDEDFMSIFSCRKVESINMLCRVEIVIVWGVVCRISKPHDESIWKCEFSVHTKYVDFNLYQNTFLHLHSYKSIYTISIIYRSYPFNSIQLKSLYLRFRHRFYLSD